MAPGRLLGKEAERDPRRAPGQPPAPCARPSWLRMLGSTQVPVPAAFIQRQAGLAPRAVAFVGWQSQGTRMDGAARGGGSGWHGADRGELGAGSLGVCSSPGAWWLFSLFSLLRFSAKLQLGLCSWFVFICPAEKEGRGRSTLCVRRQGRGWHNGALLHFAAKGDGGFGDRESPVAFLSHWAAEEQDLSPAPSLSLSLSLSCR